MQIKLNDIPIKIVRLSPSNQITIPAVVREKLKWQEGDRLEIYATRFGIFFKKEMKTNEK